jgi:hypothetical protein
MQVARKIVRHCDALHDGVHGEMVFVPKELECVATRQEIAYPRINRAICPSYKSNKLNEAVLIIHRAPSRGTFPDSRPTTTALSSSC